MQETSAISWDELKQSAELSRQYNGILSVLRNSNIPLTATEIKASSSIFAHKRMRMMARMGLVCEGDKRKCSCTGKLAITWKLVQTEDPKSQLPL